MKDLEKQIEERFILWLKDHLNTRYTDEQILADGYYQNLLKAFKQGASFLLEKWQEKDQCKTKDLKVERWLIEKGFNDMVVSRGKILPYVYTSDAIKMYLQDAERWRKVEEELPEVKAKHYFINVRKKEFSERIETLAILAGEDNVKEYLKFYNVIEWKPIN